MKISHFSKSKGFTLIEVLIAITVTALLGLGVWQVLGSTIKTQEVLNRQQAILNDVQRLFLNLERDIQQVVSRPVRNEYGDIEFALSNRNSLYKIEFTRLGWRNPLGDKRSEVQRVAYEMQDEKLVRHHWGVLDRAQDSEARTVVLNDKIKSFSVSFLNDKNGWSSEWPTDNELAANEESSQRYYVLPKAIKIELEHALYGKMYRVFQTAQTPDLSTPEKTDNQGQGGTDEG